MLDDDTCYFLAVDFDEEDFKESVNIFVNECALYNLDCLVEVSRSGNGAHVWFFFDNKYPAIKIRKIISSILTTAMLKSGKISFSSYDRMFPSQDKLLKNGIGNLIALPLNGKSGKNNTAYNGGAALGHITAILGAKLVKGDSIGLKYQIEYDWKPSTDYQLIIDSALFASFIGLATREETFAFKTKSLEEYDEYGIFSGFRNVLFLRVS